MKKKTKDIYYHGKGTGWQKKSRDNNPVKGYPNSNIDFYDKNTGKLHRRRKIGQSGSAAIDYDVADAYHDKDHSHKWFGFGKDLKREYKGQPLNKKQQKEFNKAKKKRKGIKK